MKTEHNHTHQKKKVQKNITQLAQNDDDYKLLHQLLLLFKKVMVVSVYYAKAS